MERSWLRPLFVVVIGGLVAGATNFLLFVYFYKEMIAEHVSEYWRTIHGGRMFDEVLPAYLGASFVVVVLIVLAARTFSGSSKR